MKDKTFVFSLLSLVIPVITYAFFFLAGLDASRPGVYAPLFASNAAGITLSILAFAKPDPTDTSRRTLAAVLLSSIAIFANIVAIEVVLYSSITPAAQP